MESGLWEQVWSAASQEFSDLPDAGEFTRVFVRLVVAIVLGGLLGLERESRGTSAGLRTHMLVALGAALFVLVPLQGGMQVADMSRVLQGVIAGIGFLGAGAILKDNNREIHGLTTAASIWLTAAIGIAAGMGREMTAILSTLFALVILALIRKFTHDRKTPPPTR
ncbi:MAG: MgtC/SapB family protein [Pigmentiphaga sp.]|uniref:MgtC/SapB family protein n=1 Tax=Pigmentiphaga sp. TaxID=1977564 RepID=UPI0029B9EBC0|nr:MgtC/SapB family protein [Pigmentiphaga sp.]MDX3905246.1 MgtC/SapB family protein [Pigmentiphaga sp.]